MKRSIYCLLTIFALTLAVVSKAAEDKESLKLDWKVGTVFEAFTAPDGTKYDNAKITRMSPDAITLMHSSGITNIAIGDLPQEFQEALGYDPNQAAAAKKARMQQQQALHARMQAAAKAAAEKAQADAAEKAKLASAKEYTFKVFQVLEEGMLVQEHRRGGQAGAAARAISSITGGSSYVPSSTSSKLHFLKAVPERSVVDGDIIEVLAAPLEETFRYETTAGSFSTVSVIEFVKWADPE